MPIQYNSFTSWAIPHNWFQAHFKVKSQKELYGTRIPMGKEICEASYITPIGNLVHVEILRRKGDDSFDGATIEMVYGG
jgi:hypothetical protein